MTVANQIPSNTFTATGERSFNIDFYIEDKENIEVFVNNILVPTHMYSVSLLTPIGARITTNYDVFGSIVINRNTTKERTTNYDVLLNPIRPLPVNEDFDRVWRAIQELGYYDSYLLELIKIEEAARIEGDLNLYEYINSLVFGTPTISGRLLDLTDVDVGFDSKGLYLTEVESVIGSDARAFAFKKIEIPEVDGLEDALADLALADHTHEISDIIGLPEALGVIDVSLDNIENTLIPNIESKIDLHAARVDNPHNVTKDQVGLSNVDNTSDLSKPISTLTQLALDNKLEEIITPSGSGVALTMNKSGVTGRVKSVIAGQDITLTNNTDNVVFATTGRTLKDHTEGSGTIAGKFYRYILPNYTGSTSPVNVLIGGRYASNQTTAYSLTLVDPLKYYDSNPSTLESNFINTGAGSVDLRISKNKAPVASTNSFVAGSNTSTTGTNHLVLARGGSVDGNNNTLIGSAGLLSGNSHIVLTSQGNSVSVSGTQNFLVAGDTFATGSQGVISGSQGVYIGGAYNASGSHNLYLGHNRTNRPASTTNGNTIIGSKIIANGNNCSAISIDGTPNSTDVFASFRGMTGVFANKTILTNIEQTSNLLAYYQSYYRATYNSASGTLTSDGQDPTTTNRFILPTVSSTSNKPFAFEGYLSVSFLSTLSSDDYTYLAKVTGYGTGKGTDLVFSVVPLINTFNGGSSITFTFSVVSGNILSISYTSTGIVVNSGTPTFLAGAQIKYIGLV